MSFSSSASSSYEPVSDTRALANFLRDTEPPPSPSSASAKSNNKGSGGGGGGIFSSLSGKNRRKDRNSAAAEGRTTPFLGGGGGGRAQETLPQGGMKKTLASGKTVVVFSPPPSVSSPTQTQSIPVPLSPASSFSSTAPLLSPARPPSYASSAGGASNTGTVGGTGTHKPIPASFSSSTISSTPATASAPATSTSLAALRSPATIHLRRVSRRSVGVQTAAPPAAPAPTASPTLTRPHTPPYTPKRPGISARPGSSTSTTSTSTSSSSFSLPPLPTSIDPSNPSSQTLAVLLASADALRAALDAERARRVRAERRLDEQRAKFEELAGWALRELEAGAARRRALEREVARARLGKVEGVVVSEGGLVSPQTSPRKEKEALLEEGEGVKVVVG